MKSRCLHLQKTYILMVFFAIGLSRLANGAATNYLWNVSTPSSTSAWNANGSWLGNGVNTYGYPGDGGDTADTAVFGAIGTSSAANSVNNVISANTTLSTLLYTNNTSGQWHVTDIPTGMTLTATNVTMGGQTGVSFVNDVAMVDAGTFLIYSNWTLGDSGNAGTPANSINTVNLGGLSNLVYNASGGTISIGFANYSLVNLTLAATNTITAGTINVNTAATSSSSNSHNTLVLGGGTNIINVGTMTVSEGRNSTTVEFPAGSTGGLLLRGVAGTSSSLANMLVGFRNTGGSSGNVAAALAFDGNPVNLNFQTLTLGEANSNPSSLVSSTGTLAFDNGSVYASNILMGISAGTTASATANGVLNIGSLTSSGEPTLYLGAGGLSMVNQSAASGPATGILNITNAEVICSNSIIKTTAAGTATISMTNGILDVVAGTVGTFATPIDNLILSNSTIHLNVSCTNTTAAKAIINGTNVTASGMTIDIDSIANFSGAVSIPVITYNLSASGNVSPYSGITTLNVSASLPAGYSASLVDNGSGTISLDISANAAALLWVGTPNANWNINSTANWDNMASHLSSVYTNPDYVTFDDTAANPTITLNANVTPSTMTFSNNTLNYSISGTGSIGGSFTLEKNDGALVTLSESGGDSISGGVAVNNGMLVLDDANGAISGGLNVSSGATAQIGTNDNNGSLPSGSIADGGSLIFDHTTITDTVATAISGTGTLVQNGSGTLTLSAVNSYSGATTVNAGTLALTGSGAISNSATVTINNGALNLSGLSSPALLQYLTLNNATLTLAMPNQSTPLFNSQGGITLQGMTNIINLTSLPTIGHYPTALAIVYAGGFSGTFNMGLGTLPAGASPAYGGYISNDNANVYLVLTSGPVGTRPNVLWVGNDAMSSGITNWTDADNWQLPGAPGAADNVVFADNDAVNNTPFSSVGDGAAGIANPQAYNNVVNTSFTIGTLTYTNIGGTSDYQNTLINTDAVLNVVSNNSLVVGSESTDFGGAQTIDVTIGGTNSALNVNNTNGTMFVGLGSANTATELATLDLSGLGTLNANVSRLLVGVGSGSEGVSLARLAGVLYLAQTNNITASIAVAGTETSDTAANAEALDVGDCDGNAGEPCFLYLGQSNSISADAIAVGRQKTVASMEFNPNFANCSAYFRGANASAVGTWSIGDACDNSGSGETANGTNDFTTANGGSDGYVNALIDTMYVGHGSIATSGTGTILGLLSFDNGVFNVGKMFIGNNPASVVKSVTGAVNVNTNSNLGAYGTLSVSGALNIGLTVAGGTPATGTLNIGGGTVLADSIVCDANGGNSTISLGTNSGNGILIVTNTVGTPGALLTTLNLNGGSLQLNPVYGATNIAAGSIYITAPTTISIASIVTTVGGAQQIVLLSYTNSDPGITDLSLTGSLPPGFSGGSLGDDGHGHIYLSVTAPSLLTWVGAVGSTLNSNWDTMTMDWSGPSSFANNDLVQFNDAASNSTVTLIGSLAPDSVIVTNNAKTYTFIGSGNIANAAPLVKQGSGLLVIDNSGANIFDNVNITAGALQLGNSDANGSLGSAPITDNGSLVLDQTSSGTFGNVISGNGSLSQYGGGSVTLAGANGSFAGSVSVTNGALVAGSAAALGVSTNSITISSAGTLDINGFALTAYTNIIVSGNGVNGAGAIVNSGAAQINAFNNLTLAGNTAFGGTSRWDVRANGGSLLTGGKPYSITKVGTNQVTLATPAAGNTFTIDQALSNIVVQAGTFAVQQVGTNTLGTNGAVTVYTNAVLELDFGVVLTNLTKPIVLLDGATINCASGANIVDNPITLSTNASGGPGNCMFNGSGGTMIWSNVVSGPGNLIKGGAVTLTLTASNVYTGNTVINSNSLILAGAGSITHSAAITISGGATLNVSAVSFALASGQSLRNTTSTAIINGSVNATSGTLALSYAAGTPSLLMTNGTLTLSSSTIVTVNNTGAQLAAGTYVIITNAPGSLVADGGTLPSVSVTGNGAVGAASLAISSGALELIVASGPAPRPVITSFSVSGNTLTFSATNGEDGSPYTLFETTNLNPPVMWTPVFTNSFSGTGTINLSTNVVNPSVPNEFYILEEPLSN